MRADMGGMSAPADVGLRSDAVASRRSARVGFVLLVGLVALVAGGKAVLFDTIDPDCFWHLLVAGQLKAEGIGPLVDRLSFASVQTAWTPYSWLAELAMKAVWDAGGYRLALGVQVFMQAGFVAAAALACGAARPAATPRCRFLPAPSEGAGGACGPGLPLHTQVVHSGAVLDVPAGANPIAPLAPTQATTPGRSWN